MAEREFVGVFVKAPLPGGVKTRLAESIGSRRAAALYRRIGRNAVLAAAASGRETVVWYAPSSGASFVRSWLADTGVRRFEQQQGGALGRRLESAFARHFRDGARGVVIIGSDCPELDGWVIRASFESLRRHDVVLGPAFDGGYYLIGMRQSAADLFRGITWSSARVLEQTVERIRALGLSYHLLPPLRDVDTVADAEALGLLAPGP